MDKRIRYIAYRFGDLVYVDIFTQTHVFTEFGAGGDFIFKHGEVTLCSHPMISAGFRGGNGGKLSGNYVYLKGHYHMPAQFMVKKDQWAAIKSTIIAYNEHFKGA